MVNSSGLKLKLSAIPVKVLEAVKSQMEAYANQIVGEMRMLAPVLAEPDPRRTPGALRNSIGWTWGKAPKGAMTIAEVKGNKIEGLFITIYAGTRSKSLGGNDAYYARWVEFGTKGAPAQPFFNVTWRANRNRVRQGINRAMKKAVQSI
ncbi:HK97-gp10 family putative phage morphogenesis protein [Paracoccus aminophilus]|uniref:Phage head/tail component n=1 Tax=Paracoccus aminophilus JCM 7686 TaxID=1367847 RepID=S5YA99_PARAH|nr:HK97-gp10 family putative phage morphogenesis protein [Paracoccus aminophilus]AGT08348.1 phage head/tail component [Paracoccus aminophilus JCM 7686]